MKKPYEELEDRFKRMDALNGALSMLYWDMSAMMPPGGVESRSEQLAVLKTLHHYMTVSYTHLTLPTNREV